MTQSILAVSGSSTSHKAFQAIGALGAVLALAILGASILLRLTTVFGADGLPLSTLSADVEKVTRTIHRLAAFGVGLLTLLACVLGWLRRTEVPNAVKPIAWIVATTVLLAVIGPITPGYRFSVVTVANVVAGTALLGSCWWLREALAAASRPAATKHPLLRATLMLFVVHVGLGAAASAFAMRGIHWVAFLHSGSGMLTVFLLGSMLWDRRKHPRLAKLVGVMSGFLAVQVALGLASLWIDGRPVGLGFVHAMLSATLVVGLVSLAQRDAPAS